MEGLSTYLVGYKKDGLHLSIVTIFDTDKEFKGLQERLKLVKTPESFSAAFSPTIQFLSKEEIDPTIKKLNKTHNIKGLILLKNNKWLIINKVM
jgi:hypothetical protein